MVGMHPPRALEGQHHAQRALDQRARLENEHDAERDLDQQADDIDQTTIDLSTNIETPRTRPRPGT
jgi:hypothetical protein